MLQIFKIFFKYGFLNKMYKIRIKYGITKNEIISKNKLKILCDINHRITPNQSFKKIFFIAHVSHSVININLIDFLVASRKTSKRMLILKN
jgi:hypothetical protein